MGRARPPLFLKAFIGTPDCASGCSPHLVAFGERIQIDRQPIPEETLAELVTELQPSFRLLAPEHTPTFFEFITVLALKYFARNSCDLVIWETGLGGRLDATNIVTPIASVITNIGFDHQEWLGDTVAKIAAEKAGIVKDHVPVITGAPPGEALDVIAQTARAHHAPLTVVSQADRSRPPLDQLALPLLGEHQKQNAALAVATVAVLADRFPVTPDALAEGLRATSWPGRLQCLPLPRGRRIFLDGAHNLDGVEALLQAWHDHFAPIQPVLLLGVLADKDWQPMALRLMAVAAHTIFVPVQSQRSLSPEALATFCGQRCPGAKTRLASSLPEALAMVRDEANVLVTGSLYLIGEALELLQISMATPRWERGLNEWGASAAEVGNRPPP